MGENRALIKYFWEKITINLQLLIVIVTLLLLLCFFIWFFRTRACSYSSRTEEVADTGFELALAYTRAAHEDKDAESRCNEVLALD